MCLLSLEAQGDILIIPSKGVLAQLDHLGELVVVTSEHVLGGGRESWRRLILVMILSRLGEGTCGNLSH